MRRIALLLALITAAPIAQAQSVRGVVRDNANRAPVPGAIVLALDSARIVLARTLTNARGEYQLQRAPQARTLRTMRLGFRPVELPIPASASDTLRMDVTITAIPVTLEAVRTVAASACPRRKDAEAALSLLEQVRTGLLATVVARESRPAIITRLAVVRRRAFDTDSILSMIVAEDSAKTTNSYAAALSAEAFLETGFAKDDGGVLTTYGPDAEVLLDDAFANGYCFRVMDAEKSRPHQVGLGFLPAQKKSGRIDIDGALWVDTVAKSLVDIEFLYRGFDRVFDSGRPGGHIEFRAMPNGVPLIDRWYLRVPNRETRKFFRGLEGVVIQETGGDLAAARWEDGTTWKASLGTVRLQLVDQRGKADAGRVVVLDSTTYAAQADSEGRLEIARLVPGPYTISLADGQLLPIGITIPTGISFKAERDSTLRLVVPTRTAEEYAQNACRSRKIRIGTAMLIGRVLEEDGKPADGVDIILDRVTDDGSLERVADGAKTGTNGLFYWCGFAPGNHIIITAEKRNAKRTSDLPSIKSGLTVVEFYLKKKP